MMKSNTSTKYGNKKVEIDGMIFDSQIEGERYRQLKLLQEVGAIEGLQVHPAVVLQPSFKWQGQTIRAIRYEADFAYIWVDGHTIYEDVKGVETEAFKLKYKMALFKGYDLRILYRKDVMGNGRKTKGGSSHKKPDKQKSKSESR